MVAKEADTQKKITGPMFSSAHHPRVVLRLLGISLVALVLLVLAGCGNTCEQDYSPPSELNTSQNPYAIDYWSTNLGIDGTSWVNQTTGASGVGVVTQEYHCIFPFGCGTMSHVSNTVELAPGLNTVYTYEQNDGCDWRSDYLITLN